MSLTPILHQAWALSPEVLDQLQAIYTRHVTGEAADLASLEASLGRSLQNEQANYSVMPTGVAVFSVSGVMAPRMNMLHQVSGGISTRHLTAQLNDMADDPNARAALVVWDSPGGSVLGVPAARDAMRRLAAAKPTVSLVQGTMASAAYWIGSAARAVYVEGATDMLGSLGVVQRLSWDAASPTSMKLVRGRYKLASVNGEAPSAEYLANAEAQLDYLYATMVHDVAQQRGASVERVLAEMADGRVFIGHQAIQAGLADGEATVSELARRLVEQPASIRRGNAAQVLPRPAPTALPPPGGAVPAQVKAPAMPARAAGAVPAVAQLPPVESRSERAERLAADAAALGITLAAAAARDDARLAARAQGQWHLDAWFAKDYAQRHGVTFIQACKTLGIR